MSKPPRSDSAPNAALVRRLIDRQCPQWRGLSLQPMRTSATENATFRLGDDFIIRLPLDAKVAAHLQRETSWLELLASILPLQLPTVEFVGQADELFSFDWTINRWIDGTDLADRVLAHDIPVVWADQLADLVTALRTVDLSGIPPDLLRGGSRGGHLSRRLEDLRHRSDPVAGTLDSSSIDALVQAALAAGEPDPTPVLLHADLIPGNLIARGDGTLVGLLDFGTLTTGYAAWDLTPAWWILDTRGRDRFRDLLDVDDISWAWGRALAATQGLLAHWYYAPRGHDLAPLGAGAVEQAILDWNA